MSPARATLDVVDDDSLKMYDGELLTTADVMSLLNVARSTVTLWRQEGRLRGYKPLGAKQWRWPSNQPAIQEALRVLRADQS
jgi:hypothetical protein